MVIVFAFTNEPPAFGEKDDNGVTKCPVIKWSVENVKSMVRLSDCGNLDKPSLGLYTKTRRLNHRRNN